jgi:hypothetical protein
MKSIKTGRYMHYPELRHARITECVMHRPVPAPEPEWTQYDQDPDRISMRMQSEPGVQIQMFREDFDRMMTIYQSHYHAENANPAVREAWHQYRMLVALTIGSM